MTFSPGDEYQIYKVNSILDQPCVGVGDFIDDSKPARPRHRVDSCYEWNNTVNGATADFSIGNGVIKKGVHIFNDTAKPGYEAFAYPLPLRGAAPGAPSQPRIE